MRVLIAYATRHGSTAGIAQRIADRLVNDGIPAEALPVEEVRDVSVYNAVVLGSAAYMGRWLRPAAAFAKRHREALQSRQVWLFSSGPLGRSLVDKDGRSVLHSSRPKDFGELQATLNPKDARVFFGAWDPNSPVVGIGERLMRLAPASTGALPGGDFRDWDAIDVWADDIAAALKGSAGAT
ncbi:flavodoxin domain-containing protein [Arthrobacter sp. CAN_C5]|uniref:flavodoxin domain-containing protein n=1 Tax=Arthrobacter sp. CAN_C5 TaxID=2760706 RepID=UPI001AEB2271|nr:flavodoxin domain-containing protein [Arthrobacter sp. CAN_C5]MBP2217227.1 menaquinone-dependent protoporphyrinogen oxidase [Arthrobacter sp. CAN_C5]